MVHIEHNPQRRSRDDVLQVLRRLAFPDEVIAEIGSKLPEYVDLDEACNVLQSYGLSRDAAMSRLGASP
jgi:hypothetical protein